MNAKRKTDQDPADEAPSRRSGTIRKPRISQRKTEPAPAKSRSAADAKTELDLEAPHPAGRTLAGEVWTRWLRDELAGTDDPPGDT